MKVLITGAAGFIGSNLVHYLSEVRSDWKLFALDSLTYAGNYANIKSLCSSEKEMPARVVFLHKDITDDEAISAVFTENKFDLVFHLAAESHVDRSILSAREFVETNVIGTQVLLSAARANNVNRFVHISTDEVYGSLGDTGVFYENTPLDPTSPYAASKAASDLMALAAFKTHSQNVVVTRCTNNYGPYQFPEKFIPLFITNSFENKKLPVYGDGMNVRSWLHVRDHCDGLLRAAEKGRAGEVYNFGGGPESEIPNLHVSKMILKLMDKPESLLEYVSDRPAHDKRYAVDFSKSKAELGWSPTVNFDDGLRNTVKWYLDNSDWWTEIKSGHYKDYYKQQYGGRLAV
jgi:dTDP-glucose 4,6-dehydratase